ncbi:Sugar transporter domain containing protein [Hyaloscypha variabilis]
MDFQRTKSTFELAGREFSRVTWYKQRGMRGLYVCLLFVVLTSATNGYDGSMMNGLQSLPQWKHYYHNPSPSQLGLLNCIIRTGVMIGCTIMILGVAFQTLGFTYGMFVGARFFIGFGVAIAHGASPLLITELVHPQHRAIYTTIYNTTWYIGSLVAAWLTFGTNKIQGNWAWRAPSLVQVFPSALQMIFIWFVPESPRWLISKGKSEQALRVLANAHAQGNEQDEVVQLEFNEIRQTLKLEKEFEGNSWSELWRTPGNRHRLIILVSLGFFSQWSGNGLASYYIHTILDQIGITNLNTQLLINAVLQIVNIVVAVGMCFFVDRLGRRLLFLVATAGMLVSFIVWTICSARFAISGSKAAADIVVLIIFVFYVWKFYIETRNTPLEEIVKHFDGEGAIIGGDAANEKSRQ